MKTKPTVVTLLLLLALVLTLSANNIAIEAHAQTTIGLLQDFCDDYAPVTLVDEEEYEASDFTTITDFAGNSYYYSTVSPQGYIIMHATTQKVVEASFDGVDPFEQISTTGDRFYAGPGQYFRKVVNEDGDLVYRSYIGQEYVLDDETLVSISQTLHTQLTTTAEVEENTASPASATNSSGNTVTLSDGFTYVKDYLFFEKLIEMCEIYYNYCQVSPDPDGVPGEYIVPDNLHGNCSFNALAILLNYHDVYHNPNILDDMYTTNIIDIAYTDLNCHYDDINFGDIVNLPIVTKELSTLLTQYIYPNYKLQSGI